MAVNKRILLLACPIFTVIAICIASVGYSSFKSLPSLQKFIQNVHITQQLKSKSRDLQFLDFSLEAGYQESFKQIYALRAYYGAILESKVDSKTPAPTASTSNFVNLYDRKQTTFATTYPTIYSKINNLALKEMLQVAGWSSNDSTLDLTSALSGISSVYSDIEQDILQFSVLMKGILAPYYLQDQSSQDSASFDLIYTLGITYPEEGFSVFMPLPTDSMLKTTGTLSIIPSAECTSTLSGDENFENVCSTTEASLYIIKDQYNSYTNAGGISQKFQITTSTSATPINAVISAEFSLSSQQAALSKSLLNNKEGSLFITLDNEDITLLSFNSTFSNTTADTAAFLPLLINQIFKDSSSTSTSEAEEFKNLFNTARDTIATQKALSPKQKYSDGPVKFEYYKNQKKNYCILSPIEVYVGDLDANDQLEIVDAQVLFYLGYIVSEQDLIDGFADTNDRLKYIELVSFVVISVVSLFTICIVARYTYMISYSFQNPIITMSKLMQEIDPEHVDQEDQYEQYQNYFTSDEIKSLFEAMVTLLKNFKYSNQRFHDDDALTLLELSRAKQFYTKFGNQNGVGICCNNIGNIHLKNSRYLEAISEYQEAILMATMEYNITIDEMKKEKIDYEFKQQLQISDQFNLINPNSPLPKQLRSTEKRKKTYLGTINNNPSSPLKKPPQSVMYSSQNSSVKPQGVNFTNNNNLVSNMNSTYKLSRDGGGSVPRPGHTVNGQTNNNNEDDIWEGDVEQSQTVRMHEQIQMQQQQETNNINDLSLQEKKIKDLLMKYDLSKTRLLNRKYQLGVALLEYSTQQKDELYHEAIRVFEKCILISDSERQSLTNLIRKILILTKKIYCHLRLGEYKQAQAHIADARLMYEQLPQMVDDKSAEENTSLFLNIFASIPQEILKSKIDLQEAILELSRFNFRKSAELLTEIVECGVFYDSQIRKFAILCLKNIMEQFRLDVPELIPKLMKFNLRTIELIMLIDYSKDMTLEQIKQSHIRCKSIFDRISPTDKIGFAQFNDLVHENFPLQQKELYNDLLEKKIRSIPMNTGGRSNLFKALEVTTGLFDRKQQISEADDKKDSVTSQSAKNNQTYVQIAQIAQNQNKSQQQQTSQQSERLRFICLFTEGNNPISEQDLIMIKDQMQKKQVNLLIINICRQNANMLYLRFLAKEISELGQFFMKGFDDVEEYLNKQREKPIKRQLIAEYF